MPPFATVLDLAAKIAFGVLVVALIACGLRRWKLAVGLTRAAALSVVVVVLACVGVFAGAVGKAEPSLKANLLSQGISELINCGALALLASLANGLLCGFASRRVRADRG
jgi:hypothetical protein